MTALDTESDYGNIDAGRLHNIFLETIYAYAEEEDNKPNKVCYYKVYGKSAWGGFKQAFIGKEQGEQLISVDGLIVGANNLARVWIKLYEHCYEISDKTTDKYLLPPLKGLESIEDDPLEFVKNYLGAIYEGTQFGNEIYLDPVYVL